MTTSLGTIPEDFPINGVYEAPSVATLPALVYGMRPNFRELIWDADGGFADDWRDRSALSGNDDDGYVFLLGRRAFSAASMAIFASGAGGGSGSVTLDGDVTGDSVDTLLFAIHGREVVGITGDIDGKVLGFVEGKIAPVDAGSGGAVGTDDVTNDSSLSGTTASDALDGVGTELGDHESRIAALEAGGGSGFTPALYQGGSFTPNLMAYVSGAWTGCISAVSTGSWTDEVQSNIARSGENFTVANAGTYRVYAWFPSFPGGTPPLRGMRCLVNGTMKASQLSYGGTGGGTTADSALDDTLVLSAGDVLSFEYCNITGTTSFGAFSAGQMAGVDIKTAQISIHRVS